MLKMCLDSNCLISLEKAETSATVIKSLIDAHSDGRVVLSVVGISASERQPTGTHFTNFDEFRARLDLVGANKLSILKPLFVSDVTYWDNCIWGDGANVALLADIHAAMFSTISFSWQEYAVEQKSDPSDLHSGVAKRWRNAHCDVQVAWASIFYAQDTIVTMNTRDFQKNFLKLETLGVRQILTPEEALHLINCR